MNIQAIKFNPINSNLKYNKMQPKVSFTSGLDTFERAKDQRKVDVVSMFAEKFMKPLKGETMTEKAVFAIGDNVVALSKDIVESSKNLFLDAQKDIEMVKKVFYSTYREADLEGGSIRKETDFATIEIYPIGQIGKNLELKIKDKDTNEEYVASYVVEQFIPRLIKVTHKDDEKETTIYKNELYNMPSSVVVNKKGSDTSEEYAFSKLGKLLYYGIGSKDNSNQDRREQMYFKEDGSIIKYESDLESLYFNSGELTAAGIRDRRGNYLPLRNINGRLVEYYDAE